MHSELDSNGAKYAIEDILDESANNGSEVQKNPLKKVQKNAKKMTLNPTENPKKPKSDTNHEIGVPNSDEKLDRGEHERLGKSAVHSELEVLGVKNAKKEINAKLGLLKSPRKLGQKLDQRPSKNTKLSPRKKSPTVTKSSNVTKFSKVNFPKASTIKDHRSEMGAFGGWVVAGPMGEIRASPAMEVLEDDSTYVGKNDFKARLIQGQDPSYRSVRRDNPCTNRSLARNNYVESSQPSTVNELNSIDKHIESAKIEIFDVNVKLEGPINVPMVEFEKIDKAIADNVNGSKHPQCHLCGLNVNEFKCRCKTAAVKSDYSDKLRLGAIPKVPKVKILNKEIDEDKDEKKNKSADNLLKGPKGEENIVMNLVKIYDATGPPKRRPYLKNLELVETKENLHEESEKKFNDGRKKSSPKLKEKIKLKNEAGENVNIEKKIEKEIRVEDIVKIRENLNVENSKVDIKKIMKKEENWLENYRRQKIEQSTEKIRLARSGKLKKENSKRKLVKSGKKKIKIEGTNMQDIRIAFKKINDRKKKIPQTLTDTSDSDNEN